MRLIDADNLCNILGNITGCVDPEYRNMVKSFLKDEPTIDPIHAAGACYCRECKESRYDRGFLYCGRFKQYRDDLDFCSCGKRREDEQ